MARNILFLMADQLAPQSLPFYGHKLVKAPHLEALAARGTVFENAYTNSPLCVPARASLMTGQLGSTIGIYDSGSELPAGIPTMGHYLGLRGYDTCLSGKCHFIGPDQIHGFHRRLTTDILPFQFRLERQLGRARSGSRLVSHLEERRDRRRRRARRAAGS
jgi:choline-sulfatase